MRISGELTIYFYLFILAVNFFFIYAFCLHQNLIFLIGEVLFDWLILSLLSGLENNDWENQN